MISRMATPIGWQRRQRTDRAIVPGGLDGLFSENSQIPSVAYHQVMRRRAVYDSGQNDGNDLPRLAFIRHSIRLGEFFQNRYRKGFNSRFLNECLNSRLGQVFTPDPQILAERLHSWNQGSQSAIQANILLKRNVQPLSTCLS